MALLIRIDSVLRHDFAINLDLFCAGCSPVGWYIPHLQRCALGRASVVCQMYHDTRDSSSRQHSLVRVENKQWMHFTIRIKRKVICAKFWMLIWNAHMSDGKLFNNQMLWGCFQMWICITVCEIKISSYISNPILNFFYAKVKKCAWFLE